MLIAQMNGNPSGIVGVVVENANGMASAVLS
jgi:hypothetical protein